MRDPSQDVSEIVRFTLIDEVIIEVRYLEKDEEM